MKIKKNEIINYILILTNLYSLIFLIDFLIKKSIKPLSFTSGVYYILVILSVIVIVGLIARRKKILFVVIVHSIVGLSIYHPSALFLVQLSETFSELTIKIIIFIPVLLFEIFKIKFISEEKLNGGLFK